MPWLDWISLFVRWFHVVAGVAWIGASFYFIWLDNNLRTPPKWKQDKGIKGDLWAIHGGGFYEVAKYAYGPEKCLKHCIGLSGKPTPRGYQALHYSSLFTTLALALILSTLRLTP